jgi:hypothetical protein
MDQGHLEKIREIQAITGELSVTRFINRLVVWDIDDTLFEGTAKVRVVSKNKKEPIQVLTPAEFNTHRLMPGQEYDFSDFRSSDIFSQSTPLLNNMLIAKDDMSRRDTFFLILTARANFDNKKAFLDKFLKYGFNLNLPHSHVVRAGNRASKTSTSASKADVVRECLNIKSFKEVVMYDDDIANLNAFLSLKTEFKKTRFKAYRAIHGRLSLFRSI